MVIEDVIKRSDTLSQKINELARNVHDNALVPECRQLWTATYAAAISGASWGDTDKCARVADCAVKSFLERFSYADPQDI